MSVPSDRSIFIAIIAHSASIIGLFGWILGVSYSAGALARQIDINTARIGYIEVNGSNGTKAQLVDINELLKRIEGLLDNRYLRNGVAK